MAEKQFIDVLGGEELAKGAKSYTDAKVGEVKASLEGYQPKGDYLEDGALDGYAKEEYVDKKVSDLVNSAPETLDTLKELADALGNDANFAATVATNLGKKLDTETYEEDKATFALKSELHEEPTAVPVETIKGWFAS